MIIKSVWTLILFSNLSSILFQSKCDALGEEQKNVDFFKDHKIVPKNKTSFFDEKVKFKSEGSSIELKSLSLARTKASSSYSRVKTSRNTWKTAFKRASRKIAAGELSEELSAISENPDIMKLVYLFFEWIFAIILGILSGMVLDLSCARDIFRNKKKSLVIAVFCRFVIAPMLSFFVGAYIMFPDDFACQAKLFALGTNLIGYLEVCWTSFLDGNFNLSIIITVLNATIYLGVCILLVQFSEILLIEEEMIDLEFYYFMPLTMIIAFIIGWMFQMCSAKLKEKSAHDFRNYYFILYILLSCSSEWDEALSSLTLAGIILSILGYFIGWMLAWAFRLPYEDRIAVAVESTIDNLVHLFTSIPMMIQIFVNKIRNKRQKHDAEA